MYDPTIPLLRISPKELKAGSQRDICKETVATVVIISFHRGRIINNRGLGKGAAVHAQFAVFLAMLFSIVKGEAAQMLADGWTKST